MPACCGQSLRAGQFDETRSANWSRYATKTDKDKKYGKGSDGMAKDRPHGAGIVIQNESTVQFAKLEWHRPPLVELTRVVRIVVSMFLWVTVCQGTLLAERTNQYLGEDMRVSWTTQ